ncbi:hypothetical protein OTU49_011360 [Cherax quadricarinatus]|uniref:Uncharacterized protein n=1 Tax=Cherax quadricarinatus TaxID=27406 RepID=A0AAW0W4M3_CHEQU
MCVCYSPALPQHNLSEHVCVVLLPCPAPAQLQLSVCVCATSVLPQHNLSEHVYGAVSLPCPNTTSASICVMLHPCPAPTQLQFAFHYFASSMSSVFITFYK